jgi:lysylphosphatidylglycerol synthetase-like protein (DUF2156 family)
VVTGSRRGLTALGASLLVLVIGGIGAAADVVISGELGMIFAVLFVLACTFGAMRVHVDDLIGVAIMPPLAYAVITAVVGFAHPAAGSNGAGLKNKAIDIGSELILRAPALLIAVLAVILIAVIRGRRAAVARRERERSLAQAAARRRRDGR